MHSTTTGRHLRGFTVIELMVVVAMLSVLLALALPSFQRVIERWRVQQAVDSLRSTMFYARSEAIRRGGAVYVQKLPGCTQAPGNAAWDCGWVVFIDANNNQLWESGEELQRFVPPDRLTVTRSTSSATIALDRWGVMGGGDLVGFTIAPLSGNADAQVSQDVCIWPGGRIQVAARAANACAV